MQIYTVAHCFKISGCNSEVVLNVKTKASISDVLLVF